MMQNGLGASFWDAHGVEIGSCAIFDHFAVLPNPVKFAAAGKNMPDLMLGVRLQYIGTKWCGRVESTSTSPV